MEVVRLGAFADYETEDEYREQSTDSPLSAEQIADALSSFRSQFSIAIEEFAILADGRRLVLDRQGFSGKVFGYGGELDQIDQWALLTVEDIDRALPSDRDRAGGFAVRPAGGESTALPWTFRAGSVVLLCRAWTPSATVGRALLAAHERGVA